VGGDFYLVAEGPDDATIVVVGDVVGKGIEAARRATFVRAALATFADFTDDPCRLLEMANSVLIERAGTSSNFVTAVCATHRPGDTVVRWAIAGHPPPLRLDDGVPLEGARPSVPLGIDIELRCELAVDQLEPGHGIVLFTDGLIEARSRDGGGNGSRGSVGELASPPMLGVEGVEGVLARHRGETPAQVVEALRVAAMVASDGVLADDLCIVALRARA
jgi:serine phosphatase RsbU (regulator of sigma subunit)